MKSTFYMDVRDDVLRARITGKWNRLRDNLLRVMRRLAIGVQGAVKETKLTGQVLHVRTGTLRRSINQHVDDEGGGTIVASVGTNVSYAHVHEFGFDGVVNVRAHLRRSVGQMNLARFRTRKNGERVEIRGSYTKAGGGPGDVRVQAHQRHMRMPERSFLRSTLAEWQGRIRQEIREAVRASL